MKIQRPDRSIAVLFGIGCAIAVLGVDGPAPPSAAPSPPADFKIVARAFDAGKTPKIQVEFVARRGRIYRFGSDRREEVIIFDPAANNRIALIDLGQQVQADLTASQLDDELAKIRAAIEKRIAGHESNPDRGERLAAAMTRNLLDPRFVESPSPQPGRLRLISPAVEVDAAGVVDTDPGRVAMVRAVLIAMAKLRSVRDPTATPPDAELAALDRLDDDPKRRPTEVSLLYRLAGPPRRERWTYQLVPELTAREVEALTRVDRFREKARPIRSDLYLRGIRR